MNSETENKVYSKSSFSQNIAVLLFLLLILSVTAAFGMPEDRFIRRVETQDEKIVRPFLQPTEIMSGSATTAASYPKTMHLL